MDDDDLSWCLCCIVKSCFGCLCGCCLCAVDFACSICGLFIAVVLICVLVPAFGVVRPVRATVKDASVSRLALAGANGTALAYDLSFTVALRNRNWAMRAEHAAPLDTELSFAGRRLAGARLAEADRSMDPKHTEEFPMRALSPLRGLEVGGDAAAEFARQSAAGVVELELRLTGALKYRPVHAGGSKRLDVTCPLKLPVEPAPDTAEPHFMSTAFDKAIVTCY